MHNPMYYFLAVIIVLLHVYCYASPVPSVDQQTSVSTNSNQQLLKEYYYLKMLCKRYGRCHDDDEEDQAVTNDDYDDIKHKRLTSSLFHGIPKFGKRALKSAFAGLPKFG